jgi:hypothetical protein
VSTPSSDGRPSEALAALTQRLSELLASEDGTLLLARLQSLALAARPTGTSPRPAAAGGRIGVWEPRLAAAGALEFVRSEAWAHEWRFWADVERIPPKARRRVVLLGESAARGYLYDPAVTPAAVLQRMLPGAEVVDFARTDLTAPELASLLDGLHALEPDTIVLFAGNNWHTLLFELTELQRLAATVRERGYAGCRRVFIDEIVVPRARALMDALAGTARDLGAAVVVVVPEFNLLDWRGEPSLLAPVLPDGGNAAWMEAHRRGREALRRGDVDGASAAAAEMFALDGGTSAVGPTLLAEALLPGGRQKEARVWLEAARDAVYGILVAHSPRCPGAVQGVLRDKAGEHGFALVDLPRVFERALGGELPDRRLFLDYCHLTLEGMRVAMAEVATRLGGEPAAGAPAIDPADEGVAHFLAAIHNAHYGQSDEIVRHHCARALELCPGVADVMLAFVDSQLRHAERWMCRSFETLSRPAAVRRYLAAADPRVMEKLADFDLIEAMVGALEAAGVPARAQAAALLREDDASGRPVDLLAARRRATTFRGRGGYSLGPERAYVQALDTTSAFFVARADAKPLRCRLTCRLPGGEGAVVVRVNGMPGSTLPARREWTTFEFTLPGAAGVNRIELAWPVLPLPPDSLERAARRLERGAYPDVLPILGELHAFTVSS